MASPARCWCSGWPCAAVAPPARSRFIIFRGGSKCTSRTTENRWRRGKSMCRTADAALLPTAIRHAQAWVHRRTAADLAGQLTALERRFPAWPVVGSARQEPPGVPAVRGFWDALELRLLLE